MIPAPLPNQRNRDYAWKRTDAGVDPLNVYGRPRIYASDIRTRGYARVKKDGPLLKPGRKRKVTEGVSRPSNSAGPSSRQGAGQSQSSQLSDRSHGSSEEEEDYDHDEQEDDEEEGEDHIDAEADEEEEEGSVVQYPSVGPLWYEPVLKQSRAKLAVDQARDHIGRTYSPDSGSGQPMLYYDDSLGEDPFELERDASSPSDPLSLLPTSTQPLDSPSVQSPTLRIPRVPLVATSHGRSLSQNLGASSTLSVLDRRAHRPKSQSVDYRPDMIPVGDPSSSTSPLPFAPTTSTVDRPPIRESNPNPTDTIDLVAFRNLLRVGIMPPSRLLTRGPNKN